MHASLPLLQSLPGPAAAESSPGPQGHHTEGWGLLAAPPLLRLTPSFQHCPGGCHRNRLFKSTQHTRSQQVGRLLCKQLVGVSSRASTHRRTENAMWPIHMMDYYSAFKRRESQHLLLRGGTPRTWRHQVCRHRRRRMGARAGEGEVGWCLGQVELQFRETESSGRGVADGCTTASCGRVCT